MYEEIIIGVTNNIIIYKEIIIKVPQISYAKIYRNNSLAYKEILKFHFHIPSNMFF